MSMAARHLALLMLSHPLCAQRIVGDGAQARDDVGVFANARGVLCVSKIAHVVAAVFDAAAASDSVSA